MLETGGLDWAMEKHFNTAGPSRSATHYLLDPLTRIDLPTINSLIQQERYFVLHAPRQTGKTTCLLALRDHFNGGDQYRALYVNIEAAQAARSNVSSAMRAIVSAIARQCRQVLGLELTDSQVESLATSEHAAIQQTLNTVCTSIDRPLVLFLDEVDALVGDSLISLLRQIRAGYTDRPKFFPQTIVLCGVRDVRDYRMTMADGEVITGGSAFNIKAESLRLGDFTFDDMKALYQQHTDACGQTFTDAALQLAWTSTRGQPWLVNALAEQAVFKTVANRDRSVVIDVDQLRAAREALILRNDTHLDQLADKLKEPRVRAIIEPMLMGDSSTASEPDVQYLLDLGLIRQDQRGLGPANDIYAEVLPRVLSSMPQRNIHIDHLKPGWLDANGQLLPLPFLRNFFQFWREHGEPLLATAPYAEAAPHLVLMAYLQRVVNGAGRIEREYAAGSGRLDLLLVYGQSRMAIEVKTWRDGRKDPLPEGLNQIGRYLDRLSLDTGFLIIFDQRRTAGEWESRISENTEHHNGKTIVVFRG
jgi:type II secretory pathway predicted ATPase ExeA